MSCSRTVTLQVCDAGEVGSALQAGVYGWRKRCLYLLVAILAALVLTNFALTLWIVRLLDFTMDGMGSLRIRKDGLRLDGQAVFSKSLYASKIRSRQDQSLRFESAKNITIHTRNSKGKVTSQLHLGSGKLEVTTPALTVRRPSGDVLLHASAREVVVAADRMRVTGENGVRFDGSIQTSMVRSDPSKQLRLESPTRSLRIRAPEGVGIESRGGDISATCLKDLYLRSIEGRIVLDSESVVLQNVRTAFPARRGQPYRGVFSMCACADGRLFMARPENHCVPDYTICPS